MAFSEREMIEWIYSQLKSGGRQQAELCAAFESEANSSSDELITFLCDSKYFRKTGLGDESSWMISANREDDLRDYLAD